MKVCLHCDKCKTRHAKGLCQACWRKHGDKYPDLPIGRPSAFNNASRHEETMEELDAMIAEQMKCLPYWWHSSSDQMDGKIEGKERRLA